MKIQEIEQRSEFNKDRIYKKKKRRRKFRFFKFMFTLVLFIAAIVFLALSPLFNISRIEVLGSKQYKTEEIVSKTSLAVGNNAFRTMGNNISSILSFRYLNDENKIKKSFPYVKDAAVKYIIPGKVIINISERIPAYIIITESASFLMDREGVLIDTAKDIKGINLPVIKGLKFEKFEVGQALIAEEIGKLKYVTKLKDAIEESDKEDTYKLSSILNYYDASDLKNNSIMLESRITINFGDLQDLNYRIRYAKHLLQKALGQQDKGCLDFSGGDNPRFLPEENNGGG